MNQWFSFLLTGTSLLTDTSQKMSDAVRTKDSEFKFPTVSNTNSIPVVFGTCQIASPNVINYGGISADPIRKSYSRGLFHHKGHQTVGYKYSVSQELALCWGVLDSIEEVHLGDYKLSLPVLDKTQTTSGYANDKLFGDGDGIDLTVASYLGEGLPYEGNKHALDAMNRIYKGGERPRNTGVARFFVWGYIGNSSSIKAFKFVVKRISRSLGDLHASNGHDANPAHVIYEALTNDLWGAGLSNVDKASFVSAAETLFNENNMISISWDGDQDVNKFIDTVCDQINAIYYSDLTTGDIKLKLIRDDFDVSKVKIIDDSKIRKFRSMKRADSSELASEIKIKYISRAEHYKEMIATAVNASAFKYIGRVVSKTKEYHGVSNAKTALDIANRELALLSMSPAENEVQILMDHSLSIGETIKLTYSRLGIKELVSRITSINWGTLENNYVTLKLVEDAFHYREGQFSTVPKSGWLPPVTKADAITTAVAIPVGAYFTSSPAAILIPELNGSELYSLYESLSGASDKEADYMNLGRAILTPVTGVLLGKFDKSDDSINLSTDYVATDATDDEIRDGKNLAVIYDNNGNHEFVAYSHYYMSTDSSKSISGVYRGLLDTCPRDWPTISKIAFIDDVEIADFDSSQQLKRNYRFVGRTWNSEGDFSDSRDVTLSLSSDYRKPLYAPVFWGNSRFIDELDMPLTINWKHRTSVSQVTLPKDPSEPISDEVYEWTLYGDGIKIDGETDSTLDHVSVTADMITNYQQLRFTLKTKRNGFESPIYDHSVSTA